MSEIRLEHVIKDFDLRNGLKHTTIHAVKDASFSLESGKTIALVGESGSGKSTIARMITCLRRLPPAPFCSMGSLCRGVARRCTNIGITCRWCSRIRSPR